MTGSVSGIFGIDSLALFGSEAGGTDAASALQSSIDYSKKAVQNGAIVTLSTHMPNFTNAKIKKNADGTYDFYNCDFNEAKDLSGDSLKKILPGGEKNEVFKAYLDTIAFYANALEKENIPVISGHSMRIPAAGSGGAVQTPQKVTGVCMHIPEIIWNPKACTICFMCIRQTDRWRPRQSICRGIREMPV